MRRNFAWPAGEERKEWSQWRGFARRDQRVSQGEEEVEPLLLLLWSSSVAKLFHDSAMQKRVTRVLIST